jgi:hypothetical protein
MGLGEGARCAIQLGNSINLWHVQPVISRAFHPFGGHPKEYVGINRHINWNTEPPNTDFSRIIALMGDFF